MAYGPIDIENIDRQANLAQELLGPQHYAGHVSQARQQAFDLPGLGYKLELAWQEMTALAAELEASNGLARDGMERARQVMFGNSDTGEIGVIRNAEKLLGGSGQSGEEIRNRIGALGTGTTMVLEGRNVATTSTGAFRQSIERYGEEVRAIGVLAGHLTQRHFSLLIKTAEAANGSIDDYIRKV